MSRVNIGNGRWFETKSAQKWKEATRWNGNNHVSIATGSQWEHEVLYKTARGVWILHSWSQWQGSKETYEIVSEETAHTWLLDNDHEVPLHVLAAAEL